VKGVPLPLEVGTKILSLWRDGKHHPAKIIERRKLDDEEEYEYYVHYTECECSPLPAVHYTECECCPCPLCTPRCLCSGAGPRQLW